MTITAKLMTNAYQTNRGIEWPDKPRNTSGSCNPISRKMNPFSRNSTISHTGPACSRVREEVISGMRQP